MILRYYHFILYEIWGKYLYPCTCIICIHITHDCRLQQMTISVINTHAGIPRSNGTCYLLFSTALTRLFKQVELTTPEGPVAITYFPVSYWLYAPIALIVQITIPICIKSVSLLNFTSHMPSLTI